MFAVQSWNLDAGKKNNYNKAISGAVCPGKDTEFAPWLAADRND